MTPDIARRHELKARDYWGVFGVSVIDEEGQRK